ncbi:hypothetical protein CDAR_75121 [Caerostris darwini]|uniref:Uncharacterized protein n=1 Tax=Caerostris darwini TaxID=1538125 RepID=A0AAV4MW38_9ARAC|nr:hypothetical protein CDAR_75121 [Caerostris darwini]
MDTRGVPPPAHNNTTLNNYMCRPLTLSLLKIFHDVGHVIFRPISDYHYLSTIKPREGFIFTEGYFCILNSIAVLLCPKLAIEGCIVSNLSFYTSLCDSLSCYLMEWEALESADIQANSHCPGASHQCLSARILVLSVYEN